jgi:hypothetical protein
MKPSPSHRILRSGLLAAGLALAAGKASAALIYSGVMDIIIATTFDGVYIDIDGMTSGTTPEAGWDFNPFFGGSVFAYNDTFQVVSLGTDNTSAAEQLGIGTVVDGTLVFNTSPGGSSTHIGGDPNQFAPNVEGYIGFSFTTNDASGPYYGWMRLVVTANEPGAIIKDWVYDDSGAPVTIGVIPEPSSLLLLALAPLLIRRRR